AVRPERMSLKAQPGPANRLIGRVREVIFVGDDSLYYVRTDSGIQVMVREQNQTPAASDPGYQPGQSVTVEWSPMSTSVLVD
ncbi:MAG: TOBE domain-containing protein, partial [Anaerolineales bacterium]